MSSDSDSDMCDFSSDVNKHLSKGMTQFWKGFKANKRLAIVQDSEEISEGDVGEPEASKEVETEKPLTDIIETHLDATTTSNTNGCDKIVDKLNDLSETIRNILSEDLGRRAVKKTAAGPKRKCTAQLRRSSRIQAKAKALPVITLESDDDEMPVNVECTVDNTITVQPDQRVEFNSTVMVKVLWKSSENKIFKVKKFQPLKCIYDYYANEAKVNPKLLLFTIDDKPVDLHENSYVSLRLSEDTFIEGGVLPESYLTNPVSYPSLDGGLLKFKIQCSAGKKKKLDVSCKQSDKIDFILSQIVKEIKWSVESVKLYFDGQLLKGSDSISDLGLEEGDCFDLQSSLIRYEMDASEVLQKKLYFLVEQLQNMARDLPPKYQMRVPYELLSSLANCLLNDTIFEIVKGLMEIQHVTEQHLFQQRLQFLNKQKLDEQEVLDRTDMNAEQKVKKLNEMKVGRKDEMKQFDMSLVLQLDQKVMDQQQTLEQAGVPGFYATKNTLEIKVQMHLLDFILRLSKMEMPT